MGALFGVPVGGTKYLQNENYQLGISTWRHAILRFSPAALHNSGYR